MINTLGRAATLCALHMTAVLAFAAPAFSQAPTDAQRSAIRSACRADYEAHCSSIAPGGAASLQCLQKNMSSLSSSCQTAVRAVEAPAAPKAESQPAEAQPKSEPSAPTTPKAAAGTASKKPSSAQIAAIRSACRGDYPKVCAGVPTGGAPALNCLEKNKAKVSPSCAQAVSAVGGSAGGDGSAETAPGGSAAAATGVPAGGLMLREMRPREVIFVLRSACGEDVRALCAGMPVGGGRIVRCLADQAPSLSPACKGVLAQFAR